jgi:CheY-like chemotaxis protein
MRVTIMGMAAGRRPTRLLIVEDNMAEITLVRHAIQDACPSPVEIVSVLYGDDALLLLETDAKFDLVILDLSLPKMSGHALLQRYKPHYPPTVVFTSSLNENAAERAIALGAREFIRKPSNYEEYIDAICGMIERWGGSSGA